MPPARPRRRWLLGCLKFGILGLVALLLLTGGYLASLALIARNWPPLELPEPTMPEPNAYDRYVAAGLQVTTSPAMGQWGMPLSGHRQVVAPNRRVLAQVRTAFPLDCRAWPLLNITGPPNFSYLARLRSLSRLFLHEGFARGLSGDAAGAVQSGQDAVEMGLDTGRGSIILGYMVMRAAVEIGSTAVWRWHEQLSPEATRAAVARSLRLLGSLPPVAGTEYEELWIEIQLLRMGGDSVDARVQTVRLVREQAGTHTNLHQMARALLAPMPRLERDRLHYHRRRAELAAQPWDPQWARQPDLTSWWPSIGSVAILVAAELDVEAHLAAMAYALALHGHHTTRGAYPERLDELVPEWLPELPRDPWQPDQPWLYRRDGNGYLLYNRGPDGDDDGGRPLTRPDEADPVKRTSFNLRQAAPPADGGGVVGVTYGNPARWAEPAAETADAR